MAFVNLDASLVVAQPLNRIARLRGEVIAMPHILPGFEMTYGVDLLCERATPVWKPRLLEALRKRCPAVQPLTKDASSELLAFVHPDHMVQYTDGRGPAQTFVHASTEMPNPEYLEPSLQQSWIYPTLKSVLPRCTASVFVSEIMSSLLPYRERLNLFQRVLGSVLEVVPTLAINWRPTQQLVDPLAYLAALRSGGSELFFAGAINVRFFNIENSNGDMLMDTLGLAALGLRDLQCHFRHLEPGEVSRVLHNTAFYVFENGVTIEDGDTVAGHTRWSKWRCRHELALVEPEREVVDLNPGNDLAAGERAQKDSRDSHVPPDQDGR